MGDHPRDQPGGACPGASPAAKASGIGDPAFPAGDPGDHGPPGDPDDRLYQAGGGDHAQSRKGGSDSTCDAG